MQKQTMIYFIVNTDKLKGPVFDLAGCKLPLERETLECISCYTCKFLQQIKYMECWHATLHPVYLCLPLRHFLFMTKRTMSWNETPKMSKPVDQKSNSVSSASLPSAGKVITLKQHINNILCWSNISHLQRGYIPLIHD